jgi:hypothetical protein
LRLLRILLVLASVQAASFAGSAGDELGGALIVGPGAGAVVVPTPVPVPVLPLPVPVALAPTPASCELEAGNAPTGLALTGKVPVAPTSLAEIVGNDLMHLIFESRFAPLGDGNVTRIGLYDLL